MLSLVLGLGGSSSRMIRSVSSNAASRSRFCSNGVVPVKQLVEQHAERIDVAAGVDVELIELGLLGAHVFDVPMTWPNSVNIVRSVSLLGRGLGDAEVDHFGDGAVVVLGHEDVRGFDVAVDDALLMGMLHGLADLA